jgi:hypothetical protein
LNFENSFQKSVWTVNASVQRRKLPESGDGDRWRTDNMGAVIYDPNLWPIFVHESAHVLCAHRLGLVVKRIEVTIADGSTFVDFVNYDHASLSNYFTVLLAGETAEVEVFGRHVLPRVHAGSDRERLYRLVAKAGPLGQQELFIARQKVKRLVRTHRGAIVRLASELLATATADGVVVEGPRLAALLDVDGAGILHRAAV